MTSKRIPRPKQARPRPGPPAGSGPKPSPSLQRAGFRLALGRTVWHLTGAEDTENWLAEFARILELEPWRPSRSKNGQARRLHFVASRNRASDPTPNPPPFAAIAGLAPQGWSCQRTNPVRMWTNPASSDVVIETRFHDPEGMAVDDMAKSCYAFYPPVISEGGLILHAALIERNGWGVALAASGGVGKSTCARRIPAPWKVMCDDTCLVLPDGQGRFLAHPFATWSDYFWKRARTTWKVESRVPLRAVFFLKHSPQDNVLPLGQGESSVYLSRSSHEILSDFLRSMDREGARTFRQKIFSNACALRQTVPAYWLEVNLEGRFWTEIERALG